jgi:hypothetical protein
MGARTANIIAALWPDGDILEVFLRRHLTILGWHS